MKWNGAANALQPHVSSGGAFLGEVLATAVLVGTVFSYVTVLPNVPKSSTGPLTIGLAVLIAHFALFAVDGCSINPARSFGSALISGHWDDFWVFIVGPFVGGALAALFSFVASKALKQA